MSKNTADIQSLQQRYKVLAPPSIVFRYKGTQLNSYNVTGFISSNQLISNLNATSNPENCTSSSKKKHVKTRRNVLWMKQNRTDGELVMRTIAMPADTNSNGDIFGGWVLSQMDLGGGIIAKSNSPTGRAVTVSIDSMSLSTRSKSVT